MSMKLTVGGSKGEEVETFSQEAFEFREARMLEGDQEAGVRIMHRMRRPGRMRFKGTGYLLGNMRGRITCGEERLVRLEVYFQISSL